MMKRQKNKRTYPRSFRALTAFILVFAVLVLSGAGLSRNDPILLPDEEPIYQKESISALSEVFRKDPSGAAKKYAGRDVIIEADLERNDISDGVASGTAVIKDGTLTVSLTDVRKSEAVKLSAGDRVYVYGTLLVDNAKDPAFTVRAHHILKGSRSGLKDDYYTYGGVNLSDAKSWSSGKTVQRSLADGKVKFRIPASWEKAELTTEDPKGLFNMDDSDADGFALNALKGKEQAECFFAFYFNYDRYLRNESDKNEIPGVERAIITNICPDENLSWMSAAHYTFPTVSETTTYGRTFDHYVAVYGTHRVEFVFTPAKDGLCVFMYVYSGDRGSVDDILYVMRTLEV